VVGSGRLKGSRTHRVWCEYWFHEGALQSPRYLMIGSRDKTREAMLLLVDDDWVEDHHELAVQDSNGTLLTMRKVPEGRTGSPECMR